MHKSLLLPLIATVGLTGLAVATPADAATSTVYADADAYVATASTSANYGSATRLVVDARTASTRYVFAQFRIPTGAENETAELSLRPTVSSSVGVNVYATSGSWTENTLTWANMPTERGALIGASDALVKGVTETISLDSAAVTPGSVLGVRIETTARAALGFYSSEASSVAARPSLRLTTADDTAPPQTDPPSTPTPADPPAGVPTTAFPPAAPVSPKLIGMSAPANLWAQRLAEVGANGVSSRRIFANLSSTGSSSLPLIKQSIADGMMPVISYKVPSVDALVAGQYDQWLSTLRSQLVGLDAKVTATFWHEPHGDMDPAKFRAASLRFFNAVDAPSIAVGPILNGWLLDRRVSDFASYTDATLLNKWEFVAVDSYQSGEIDSPGTSMPARAVPLLAKWMDSVGQPNKPIGLGEYNGFTAEAMAQAGETLLSTPEVWFGLAWNSQGGSYAPLTGDRITAFQQTKADTRAQQL